MNIRQTVICCLLILLTGCAGGAKPKRDSRSDLLRWPSPPGPAKIEWLQDVSQPQDLGIEKGFWKKLVEFVTGEERTGMVRPYGVYSDNHGRLYVADSGASVVLLYDREEGRAVTLRGSDEHPLRLPIGITGDSTQKIYVTDSASAAVFSYTPGDDGLKPFITGGLDRPTGIVCDAARGRLYVTDTVRNQIVAFDLSGRELLRFGAKGTRAGQFNYPTDICLDRRGRIIVNDSLNFRFQLFSADGGFVSMFGTAGDSAGYLSKPKGVAVDSDGHLYSADALLDAVQVFDVSGRFLLTFGTRGIRPGEFWMPSGLFIDSHDIIYVADTYNRRIQLFRYLSDGSTSTVKTQTRP